MVRIDRPRSLFLGPDLAFVTPSGFSAAGPDGKEAGPRTPAILRLWEWRRRAPPPLLWVNPWDQGPEEPAASRRPPPCAARPATCGRHGPPCGPPRSASPHGRSPWPSPPRWWIAMKCFSVPVLPWSSRNWSALSGRGDKHSFHCGGWPSMRRNTWNGRWMPTRFSPPGYWRVHAGRLFPPCPAGGVSRAGDGGTGSGGSRRKCRPGPVRPLPVMSWRTQAGRNPLRIRNAAIRQPHHSSWSSSMIVICPLWASLIWRRTRTPASNCAPASSPWRTRTFS